MPAFNTLFAPLQSEARRGNQLLTGGYQNPVEQKRRRGLENSLKTMHARQPGNGSSRDSRVMSAVSKFRSFKEPAEAAKPIWVKPRITAAPKIRQIYWCNFWEDARLPEMWKTRPVIIVSYKNRLYGPCLVVPVSTEPENEQNSWSYRLSVEIERDGVTSWAVCNQPSTVSPSRFSAFRGKIPLLPKDDFNEVLD